MKHRVDEIAAGIFEGKGSHAASSRIEEHEVACKDIHTMYARVLKTMSHAKYLSPRELSEVSGVSMRDIYYLRRCGRLRGYRVPGRTHIKFTLEDLMNAMEPV